MYSIVEKPYNVVVKKYKDSYQIKTFKNSIKSKSSSYKDVKTLTKKTRQKNGNRFSDDHQVDEVCLTDQEIVENQIRSLKNSINRTKSKIYDLAKSNEWSLFANITLDPKKIDRYDYDLCKKKVLQFFNDIKKRYDKTLRYLIIPELHKDGAIHFHALIGSDSLSDLKIALQLEYSGLRTTMGLKRYNMNRYNLGFTELTYVQDTQRVSNYVTKYITKELINTTKHKQRYFRSNNLDEPVLEKTLLNTDELKKFILEQEKKALMSDNSYSKTIDIQAPGYDNQMCIYNFATSYAQDIEQSINQYFENCDISVV